MTTRPITPEAPGAFEAGLPAVSREEAWQLAESIRITPADGACGRYLGIVTARPHATGWFISARSRADLSDVESTLFRDFVSLRVYLLLTQGSTSPIWEQTIDGAWATHPKEELCELDQSELVPDSVPAGWLS